VSKINDIFWRRSIAREVLDGVHARRREAAKAKQIRVVESAPAGEQTDIRQMSLQQFLTAGATHRAIRATNVFYKDLSRRHATLGDCCSAPAGLLQPIVYETIEGGLADPWGRGEGTPSDDLIRVCGNEDRRNRVARIHQMSVELNSRHSRHLNVGDQARGCSEERRCQEIGC